jgi:nucleotide-binding universal stress UspA family protein
MMDRILVATDFSTRSDRALRRASLIARKTDSAITLVHVVDAELPERLSRPNEIAASEVLADSIATLKSHDGIDAEWRVVVADVHSGILAAADEGSADLIVVGPHRSRFRDVFVGTTAERVVRQSTRPLLIAVDTPAANHRSTLLALDFDEASKSAARKALDMGIFDHTAVVLMHAFDAPGEGMMRRALESNDAVDGYIAGEGESAAEQLQMLLDELQLPTSSQTVASMKGTPARTILESAQEVGSDLIVLGANQRQGFERKLIGSVTADVIRDAHRDVLIIPVNER